MRGRTTDLHARAEQTGVVAALLGGQVCKARYALYLRNLLPAYQCMEQALRLRYRPEFEGLGVPQIYRTESIIADLVDLAGAGWADSIPLLPSGERYASRIDWAAAGPMLIAHCYTRYLGDLNGGLLLGRRLVQIFGPNFHALAFSRFPEIQNLQAFRVAYQQNLDRAGSFLADAGSVVEEAAVAFELNIQVSVEVQEHRLEEPASAL
jgi:heme oxygenase (biliverdin-producing, ferredoxin)